MNDLLRRPWVRTGLAFGLLAFFFHAPEMLGLRALHSRGAQALLMAGFYLVAHGTGRWLGFRGFDAYRLDLRPGWSRLLAATLALGLAAKALSLGAGLALGAYRMRPLEGRPSGSTLAFDLVAALVATFLPSAAEDILTRGLFVRLFRSGWRFIAFSSAVYLVNHIFRLAAGPGEWALLLAFGAAYATALWVTGSLWAAIGLHWGWNLANVLPLLFVDLQVAGRATSRGLSIAAHGVVALLFLLLRRRIRDAAQNASPAPR